MSTVYIAPGRASGSVAAPPSKSLAHRMMIAAGLAAGESRIENIVFSEDIAATADCLRRLGAVISEDRGSTGDRRGGAEKAGGKRRNSLEGGSARDLCGGKEESEEGGHSFRIPGRSRNLRIRGNWPFEADEGTVLPCRESGSNLRFLMPLALAAGKELVFTGSDKLLSRPISVYEDLCREKGFLFEKEAGRLRVKGRLAPGVYEIPGGISSQFATGLLYALPLLAGDSRLTLIPPVESSPYIDMTLEALSLFSIRVIREEEYSFRIPGGQSYQPAKVSIEPDWSNAAYLDMLGILGGHVRVTGLSGTSRQGDRIYPELFERLQKEPAPHMDLSDCPDLGPVLFALAAALHGGVFTGVRRLRMKESDRIAAMREELMKFGIRCQEEENRFIVQAGTLHPPSQALSGHNDHRVVMALCALLTLTGGEIRGAEAVRKSFPDYFDLLRKLKIGVTGEGTSH